MSVQRDWRGAVFIATSLDGFIARIDGDIDWLTDQPPHDDDPELHDAPNPPAGYGEFMKGVDHLVMGRGTYEKVLTFGEWPYSSKHVVVLSSTLPIGEDLHVTVVRTLAQVVQLLSDRRAKGVYVDGGKTIQSFLREGLIDEMTLSRVPVMLALRT